jgi:hypothetical protein
MRGAEDVTGSRPLHIAPGPLHTSDFGVVPIFSPHLRPSEGVPMGTCMAIGAAAGAAAGAASRGARSPHRAAADRPVLPATKAVLVKSQAAYSRLRSMWSVLQPASARNRAIQTGRMALISGPRALAISSEQRAPVQ